MNFVHFWPPLASRRLQRLTWFFWPFFGLFDARKPLFWLDMGLSHYFAEGSGIYWPEKIVKPQKSHHRWRRQSPQIFNFLSKFPIFWSFGMFSPSKWLSTAKSGKEFLKYRLFWVWDSWRICQNEQNIATAADQKCLIGNLLMILAFFGTMGYRAKKGG